MEDNKQNVAENTAQSGVDTQNTTDNFDYKAEYEKMKRLKDQYSKESADWKTKYNSTLSDVEKERIANEERENYYKGIEREYNLGKITNGLSKNISDEKVVNTISEKLLDGDNIGAINELNKFLATYKETIVKQTKEEMLMNNPTPPPVSAPSGMTQAQFDALSYAERNELYVKDKATYDKFTNKK